MFRGASTVNETNQGKRLTGLLLVAVLGLAGGANAQGPAPANAVAQPNNPHTNFTGFNVHNNTIAQLADTDKNDNERTGTPSMTAQKANLPKEKQTNLGLYLTAKEAYEKWKADPEKVLLIDVRTPEEYLFVGHAPMAWKIPVAAQSYEWDAGKQQFPMKLLPDFVSRVKRVAKADDTLLVMCRSGGRSAIAVNQLAQAGFKNVYNITDGMEGDVVDDPDSVFVGQRLKNGWKNSGAPWTYKLTPERMLLPEERR
jgi:rhodanese-related sulfurtransferase